MNSQLNTELTPEQQELLKIPPAHRVCGSLTNMSRIAPRLIHYGNRIGDERLSKELRRLEKQIEKTLAAARRAVEAQQAEPAIVTPEQYIQSALISLGVTADNIKSITQATTGFAVQPNRYAVIFHQTVKLSALQVNYVPGLSKAFFDCNKLVVNCAVQS